MTQEQQVLSHMKTSGNITSIQAFRLYGITRLADRVFKLKKKGYKIEKITKPNKEKGTHAVYYMQ